LTKNNINVKIRYRKKEENLMELQKQTFTYKVKDEQEVMGLIANEKAKSKGLVTYKTAFKKRMVKGDIVEFWYIVDVCHDYIR